VYLKAKFRPKATSGTSKANRPPDVRALDRTARVLYGDLGEGSSPHLAAAVVGGQLEIAGNTGNRRVTQEQQAEADERLTKALDPTKGPGGGRSARDVRKLRALASGDYQAHHAEFAGSLAGTAEALKLRAHWSNVGVTGAGAEHGEMTVLGRLLVDLRNSPPPLVQPMVVPLGGVKLACKACKWALEAFNSHLAGPLGYQVKVSGTHGGLFAGWKAPAYLWSVPAARSELEGRPRNGWKFSDSGELLPPGGGGGIVRPYKDQDPDDSDSDWEEVD
jgi:hypothetical protein